MVKVALLSAKNPHAMGHLRTLQVLPEVESILVWDEDEQALQSLLDSQGEKIEAVFTDLDQVLSREDVFFAVAPLRTDRCRDICLRVLEAGKHILAEKPLVFLADRYLRFTKHKLFET